MSFSFLELSKFHKNFDDLKDDIDRWAYYFKNAKHISPEELNEILAQGTIFGEAYKVLERAGYSPEQLLEYTRYDLKEEEIETRIYDAMAEGAHNKAIETARSLLSMGLTVEQIAQATKLSITEIEKLKD